jgi:4-hydroxy-tetrahydrodipicolinate synthase
VVGLRPKVTTMNQTRRVFVASMAAVAPHLAAGPSRTRSAPVPRFLIPAVTPVDRKGNFDEALWRDMLSFFGEKGADGVLVLGTTGEFASFSVRERQKILEAAVKNKGSLEIVCQVGTPNLPETMELMLHAAKEGADSVLIVPPFYIKRVPLEGLARYYSALLEAARIPVLLYHIPDASGVPISAELLSALSQYDMLYGVKDSSGNQEGLLAFIKNFPKLRIFTGSPRLIEPVIRNGGAGVISGAGNVLPGETAAVFRDARAGKDITASLARLNEAAKLLGGDAGSMKFTLGELGLRESYCRPPLASELTAERKAALRAGVEKYRAS